ncbi:MAG: HEAT repeat domain-containing protein [Spirochaetales bacterium]|nr:HEAT repeat domain-containing protein [Spirochaetales bacterium]
MKYMFTLLAVCLAVLPLTAQDDGLTVEEAYLQSAKKVQRLKTLAGQEDRDAKLMALQDIERMIEEGKLNGSEEAVVDMLTDMGREGTGRIYMEQGTMKNNFPEVRRKSVELLGEIGGEESRRAITDILGQENEPMVMSEAVVALAKIGPDEDGITLQVMASAMNSQTAMNRDNNFAYAYLTSLEIMNENGHELTDEYLISELVKLFDMRNGYNTVVRKKAMEVFRTLE